jgi:hypothetical protein
MPPDVHVSRATYPLRRRPVTYPATYPLRRQTADPTQLQRLGGWAAWAGRRDGGHQWELETGRTGRVRQAAALVDRRDGSSTRGVLHAAVFRSPWDLGQVSMGAACRTWRTAHGGRLRRHEHRAGDRADRQLVRARRCGAVIPGFSAAIRRESCACARRVLRLSGPSK